MALREFRVSTSVFAFSLVLLLIGGLLLATSWWLRPASEAEDALRNADVRSAVERYGAARERFDKIPITRSLLRSVYNLVSENELALHYSLQEYDDVIERASASETSAAASFWAGCALFEKGLLEQKAEARSGWIQQAHQEFRHALELRPSDWDTKFNFEITGKVSSGLQQQPQIMSQDIMKLLRESSKTSQQPIKKAG